VAGDARFCVACGTPLAPTEPAGTTVGRPDPRDPASSGFIGRDVGGRYRILAKLGEGGMGAVYRAEQISLKRVVALKVLRPELSAEPGMVRRFNAEAELAAKLSHPNTVTLYDFGQDSDGCLFIAMEYLEGRSLRDVLTREGALAPGRALAICEQLCASLADAHTRGIVHRDLKPDNVMLVQRGRQADVVRVLDFGIAKLRDDQGDVTAMPMTRAGDLIGTPQYMAPEQIRGEKVDARTDIYALGALLYEMVTGRLAFEASTLMAILSKHLTEMPVPPRDRRPDLRISASLSQLIMDALQKDPAQRPPSMDAFADRLARLVVESGPRSGAPISGAPIAGVAAGAYPPALPENPPPGVPLLRTPPPGSMTPAEMAPYAGPGYPSPPPYSPPPYPSARPAYPSTPPPMHSPAPFGQGAIPSPYPGMAHQTGASARGGRGVWIAIGAIAAAAIGGVVVYFLAREPGTTSAKNGPTPAPGPGVTGPGPTQGSVGADFTVTPDRKLYSGDSPAPPPPAGNHPAPTGLAGYSQTGGTPWEGGWWEDATGELQLDIPKGFTMGAGGSGFGGAAMFSGTCDGVPCAIYAISSQTYGVEMSDAMIEQVVSQMQSQMTMAGQSGAVSTIRVQGRDRYSLIMDNQADGMRGQLVVFLGGDVFAMVLVQAPRASFDHTAGFRQSFFEKRVRVE
jgi:eukaryotic-like serine/threonine-protein kinase